MVLLSLDNLSTELLLKIFKYLEISDLCKLRQTCKRFNEVIQTWEHAFVNNKNLLVTNQIHSLISHRSARILSPFERLRVSINWKLGIYNEKQALQSRTKYIPWIQLERDLLWLSRGGEIKAYRRDGKGIDTRRAIYTISAKNRAEVCRFVKRNDYIFSGQTDGSLWLWSVQNRNFVFNLDNCHGADINSVDLCGSVLVSGSRDNHVKIWRLPHENSNCQNPATKIDLMDRVWSVALTEEDKSLLAIGTAGISDTSTVNIFDLINEKSILKLGTDTVGAGILDMKWASPSSLWTCGYDAYLRRWDLRTGNCEQYFEDPCESAMYCFEYDHCNTIVSGTQSNGRVVLWDTRQKNYTQMYFMECCRRRQKSSPIYGLSFDAEFLFTVTDQHVNILDFSVFSGKFRDYSNLFLKLIKI